MTKTDKSEATTSSTAASPEPEASSKAWLESPCTKPKEHSLEDERQANLLFLTTRICYDQICYGYQQVSFQNAAFCVSDPTTEDCPVVFANDAFCALTGYSRDEILGKNCRFLQGKGTDPKTVAIIRDAIRKGLNCDVTLRNYRKDGTMFMNHLIINAVRKGGRLVNFVGLQHEVFQGTVSPTINNALAERPTVVAQAASGILSEMTNPSDLELKPKDLCSAIRSHLKVTPDRVIFTWVSKKCKPTATRTFRQIWTKAGAVADMLLAKGVVAGGRVMITYPFGLEFLAGMLGCMRAGIIACSIYPPNPAKLKTELPKLNRFAKDAGATYALTTRAFRRGMVAARLVGFRTNVAWLATDKLRPVMKRKTKDVKIAPGDIAFIQYTSGSTGDPKGVMISHGALAHNMSCIADVSEHTVETQGVTWLPQYHDMGLVGCYLQALYVGFHLACSSPLHFIQHPLLWANMIERFHAHNIVAPNFAYGLLAKRLARAGRVLRGSTLTRAMIAAEPIAAATLEAMVRIGIPEQAINPMYGAAESVVFVCSVLSTKMHNKSVVCGDVAQSSRLGKFIVVANEDHEILSDGKIGIVHYRGPDLATGYWNLPEKTKSTFRVRLKGDTNFWCDSGDLGCIVDGQLYITGRLKEVIIIGGKNIYPTDLERCVEAEWPDLLRPGSTVAFQHSPTSAGVVVETRDKKRFRPCIEIQSLLSREFGVSVGLVYILLPRSVPKTTSGKLRRGEARDKSLARGWLEKAVVDVWEAPSKKDKRSFALVKQESSGTLGKQINVSDHIPKLSREDSSRKVLEARLQLRDAHRGKAMSALEGHRLCMSAATAIQRFWRHRQPCPPSHAKLVALIVGKLEETLGSAIDIDTPLMEMGLDSIAGTGFVGDLESELKVELPPTLLFNYPTVNALAAYLHKKQDGEMTFAPIGLCGQVGLVTAVAIVGMSCRFPGDVEDPAAFWELLEAGCCTSSTVPYGRWDKDVIAATLNEEMKRRAMFGSFVSNLELFDAGFFGISPAEANAMDPKQRLLLEGAHLAFTDAGMFKENVLGRRCGVFVGIAAGGGGMAASQSVYAANSGTISTAAGRISFVYDLHGPCAAYDTACSSSLVALDAAVSVLSDGRCDLALVAGVNAILASEVSTAFARAGMTSATGRCHTFDESADGYLRGEGCGVVLLQRMEDVTTKVHAVVRGVRVTSDGKSASLTAPNGLAQESLLRDTLASAGLATHEVDYLEAHGTGTALGDPLEMGALAAVFGAGREEAHPLVMGSVKANFGHLETGAGITGLIKAVLVLQHETAPPNVALRTLNPKIAAVTTGFAVHFPRQEAESLRLLSGKPAGEALVAGVSSFGYAGTIAHAIVSQPPAEMAMRVEAKVTTAAPLFFFTGQGSQRAGMGRELFAFEPPFRAAMERCEATYRKLSGGTKASLLAELFSMKDARRLGQTRYTQAALFALEWSVSELWRSRGVVPAAVLGHSVGEIAAVAVGGAMAMAMESGLWLAMARGRLMQALPSEDGVVVAVRSSVAMAEAAIASLGNGGHVAVASVNGPASVVLAGRAAAVEAVLAVLMSKGVRLEVSHAFHSPLMAPMMATFRDVLASLALAVARVPLASTVTGTLVSPAAVVEPGHWLRQLTGAVRFESALESALLGDEGVAVSALELGPRPVLTRMARSWVGRKKLAWRASLEASSSEVAAVAAASAGLMSAFPNRRAFPWRRPPHPLLQRSTAVGERGVQHTARFHATLMTLFAEHVIGGRCIFPGAGFVEMAVAAVAQESKTARAAAGVSLEGVVFASPFDVRPGAELVCERVFGAGLEMRRRGSDEEACCVVERASLLSLSSSSVALSLSALQQECSEAVPDVAARYAKLEALGFHLGAFQSLLEVWRNAGKDVVLGRLRVPAGGAHDGYYLAHPVLLNGVIQLAGFMDEASDGKAWVPAGIEAVSLHGRLMPGATAVWACAHVVQSTARTRLLDFDVFDASGTVALMTLRGFRFGVLKPQPRKVSLYTTMTVANEAKYVNVLTSSDVQKRPPLRDAVDVIIVGGGFGGLITGSRLRMGGAKSIRIVETGGDFGGAWYWNRFPGCELDTDSYSYLPLLEETQFVPSKKYTDRAENLSCARAIAAKFDLRRNALFGTSVTDIQWNEKRAVWTVCTDKQDIMEAQFVVLATGPLNEPKFPRIPGISSFAGHSFHTARWDYEYTGSLEENMRKLADKRVAIIGTGATGVQCVPYLAASAKELFVFQRTPSYVSRKENEFTDPLAFAKMSSKPGWHQARIDDYDAALHGKADENSDVNDGLSHFCLVLCLFCATSNSNTPLP